VAHFTRDCRDDKWHYVRGSVGLPSDKMRCTRNRRTTKERTKGSELLVVCWWEITLMSKSMKNLERKYKCNKSLRENCDYQIMNWSFPL
jgi:hypothetical protein